MKPPIRQIWKGPGDIDCEGLSCLGTVQSEIL